MARETAAWDDYWNSLDGDRRGCLPAGLRRIQNIERHIWVEATMGLPSGSRVLDLATGDGTVLRMIAEARTDLELIGVDSAVRLPEAPKGVHLQPGISMEALPFADQSVDLITSQFGFEYGDMAESAGEIRRALKPNGQYQMIVHHADGPIVAQNRARLAALEWALNESQLVEQAKALFQMRRTRTVDTPEHLRRAPVEARLAFPNQSVAEEIAIAILQTLELWRTRSPDEAIDIIESLQRRGRFEMVRIKALCEAAQSEAGIDELRRVLVAAGLSISGVSPVSEAVGFPPFGWHINGRRAEQKRGAVA